MFQSQGEVRPERNKRALPLREGASPRTPDDAMLVSRSSTVGQVPASEINVPFPFQVDAPVEPTLQGEGPAGHGLVKPLKHRRERFFVRDGKGLQKDYRRIRIRRKYTCAEKTMPVCCKPTNSDVAVGTCEQVHRRHDFAQ